MFPQNFDERESPSAQLLLPLPEMPRTNFLPIWSWFPTITLSKTSFQSGPIYPGLLGLKNKLLTFSLVAQNSLSLVCKRRLKI